MPEIVREKEISTDALWWSLTAKENLERVSSNERGLSSNEAFKRFKSYGPNSLPEPKRTSLSVLFLKQFQSPLIYILLIASIIVLFLGDVTDSIVILAVLLINALIGVFQEGRAQNTLLALRKFTKTDAVALRDGIEVVISDTEVVPGDIIILREGDKVPADARVLDAKNLKVDESALTGESISVGKTSEPLTEKNISIADQHNMLFKGTFIVTGMAEALVVRTGILTVIGSISKKIVSLDTDIPLKNDIRRLSRIIGAGVLAACVLVFFIGLIYGNSIGSMFFTSVAIAVSLVPEGLPVVITIVLASGAYRMAKQNALIKKLAAVEALGQATVIAVDKTGTITKNELMVEEVFVGGNNFSVSGNGYEPRGTINMDSGAIDPANHPDLLFMGKIASFCASARVSYKEDEGLWRVAGDPTEAALLVFGEKVGFIKDELEAEEPLLGELPFNSKLKYHATIHNVRGKSFLTIVGAPETIIPISKQQWFGGRALALTKERIESIENAVHAMSRKGLRVLMAAVIPRFEGELGVAGLNGACLVGIYGMRDVLREGVAEAVEAARNRGLRVVMITGDHTVTAQAIARDAGIFREGDHVLTDRELENMNETELLNQLRTTSVFARITPEHKLKLIELYRKQGEIVAMTGDGVNDALSLVAADLGVAMGKIGTEVSKEAADIVLTDDNFKSIVLAIDEGRNMYQGIKKVILYLFSTGFGELFTILFALLLSLPLPLAPTQILWLNLVTDGFLVFALGLEPREKTTGNSRPRQRRGFFDRLMFFRMFLMAIVMAIGSVYIFSRIYETDFVKGSTMALTVLAVYQWWNAWNVRSERTSVFSTSPFSNKYLVICTGIVVILQIFAVYNPFMQKVLHTTALSLNEILIVIAISLTILLVEEVRKFVTVKIWPKK